MAVQNNSEDSRILRTLVPLVTFPSEAFKALCANITVEQIQDEAIFKKGDSNTDLVYLLNGSVTLQAEGLVVETITSESESAKFALAHQIPRKIDALANGLVRIVRLDAHTVNNPPPAVYKEDQGYTVTEGSGEDPDDWMTALLHMPLFQTLSAQNLQKILISLTTKHIAEGNVVLAKESDVDYFYIVNKGQCLITRKHLDELSEIKLIAGDSFGEEYLITDTPAEETVTALTDVSLIQLEKKHFLSQIKAPTVGFIAREDMPEALGKGAILLDVRSPRQFENQNIDGSANIPLMTLRARLAEIPKDKQIIVVCAKGKTSEAAAFLLTKNKFNALVLKGGMGIEESDDEDEVADVVDNQQDTLSIEQPDEDSFDNKDSGTTEISIDDQIERLKAENESLTQLNRNLEQQNIKLKAEKEQAESQCQVLTQQLERLKEILGRLIKSK